MGLSFKENIPDIRNSKSFDFINYLKMKKINVDCFDNNVDHKEVEKKYKIKPINFLKKKKYDAVAILVSHKNFINYRKKILSLVSKNGIIYDLKNIYNTNFKIFKANEKYL